MGGQSTCYPIYKICELFVPQDTVFVESAGDTPIRHAYNMSKGVGIIDSRFWAVEDCISGWRRFLHQEFAGSG